MTKRTFTSASANKYLRALRDEKDHLLALEKETCTYVLSQGEEAEPPEYDYGKVRADVDEIDRKTRILRHALHAFNVRTVLPRCGMSIDEALVELACLSSKRTRLDRLRSEQPRRRVHDRFSSAGPVAEYRYANYDIARAADDYREVSQRVADLQLEIDLVNQTEIFEVDL